MKIQWRFVSLFILVGIAGMWLTSCLVRERVKFITHNSLKNRKIFVSTTIEPILYFIEQIGGDRVEAVSIVPPGKQPETFSPSPQVMSTMAWHRLYFQSGMAAEESILPALTTIAPSIKVVDLRVGLDLLPMECSHGDDEDSGHGEHCSHSCGSEGLDPHFWMSPQVVREFLPIITKELSLIEPSNAKYFQSNQEKLDIKLRELQAEIAQVVDTMESKTLFVYHPAYGYFCREYHLEQHAVEAQGKSPKPQELAKLIALAQEKKIDMIIVQPEFPRSSAEVLSKATGAMLVVHSPLTRDYFTNIHGFIELIRRR